MRSLTSSKLRLLYCFFVLFVCLLVLVYSIFPSLISLHDPADCLDIEQRVIISPQLFNSSWVLEVSMRHSFESRIFGCSLYRAWWSDEGLGLTSPSRCTSESGSAAFGFKYVSCQQDWHPVFFSFIRSSEYECLTSCKPRTLCMKKWVQPAFMVKDRPASLGQGEGRWQKTAHEAPTWPLQRASRHQVLWWSPKESFRRSEKALLTWRWFKQDAA